MHHPTTQPRASLYYDYHVHEPWFSPENTTEPHPVVIAGAGPAGLTLALELARQGVAVIVLESELQMSEGSRAIVFTRRSLEILQQVGADKKVTTNGLAWSYGNSYYRDQCVFRMENPHSVDDRFYPMINLQQQYLEQYLLEEVANQPLIELRWGNKLVDHQDQNTHVNLEIQTPKGAYSLQTHWLVATDGARSAIRQRMGLKMAGASYEGQFVIADIRIDLPLPTERLAFFDPPWNPGNTVLMHREPHGIWRVDYQLPKGENAEQALQPESLQNRINATLEQVGYAHLPWELDWASVYSARALSLPSYVHNRVLFAGDAAHMLPIFGVRGANTGFQDAQSLGWHLAYVIKGLAKPEFLHNYSQERVGAAQEIIEEAGKSTRFMAPPTPGFRLLRDAVLSLSLSQDFVRPLYHWRTSRPHAYDQSLLNSQGDDNALFKTGPANGAPPKNIRLASNNYLLDHIGGYFDLVYFADETGIPEAITQVVQQAQAQSLPIRLHQLTRQAQALSPGVHGLLIDAEQRMSTQYGLDLAGGAYLFRPDQHICGRWINLDPYRLQQSLNALLSL